MAAQLDAGFWRAFYEENWVGDRPRVIKNAFEGAIADDHELLTGLKNLRAMLEAQPESIYTLFLGRERISDELHRWLPEKKEHSFDEYWARIERKASPRELFLHVYPFHAHAPEQFGRRFRVWLNNLHAFTEIRTQDVAVELFFGNYRKSLVGVHRDTNAVFCFVARGRKRFRVWPRDIFTFDTPYPFLFDYDEHLHESILLEGEAGDVFFWPSSYWHIAEADDDLSLSFSLSVPQPQPDMNDWNLDPDEYDRVMEPLLEDIPFFVEHAKHSGGPVLELGSGTGRLSIPIARAGIQVTGVELSPLMLRRAIAKAKAAQAEVGWIWDDFRKFSVKTRFPLIFLAYHTIHHIRDYDSFSQLFDRIREHLAPGGTLIIWDQNPASPGFDMRGERRPQSEEVMNINRVRWFEGERARQFSHFYPKEYEALLAHFGFRISQMLGDPQGGAYRPDSRNLILVCQLRSTPRP